MLWSLVVIMAAATTAAQAGSLIALERTMPNQVQVGDVFEYQVKITIFIQVRSNNAIWIGNCYKICYNLKSSITII